MPAVQGRERGGLVSPTHPHVGSLRCPRAPFPTAPLEALRSALRSALQHQAGLKGLWAFSVSSVTQQTHAEHSLGLGWEHKPAPSEKGLKHQLLQGNCQIQLGRGCTQPPGPTLTQLNPCPGHRRTSDGVSAFTAQRPNKTGAAHRGQRRRPATSLLLGVSWRRRRRGSLKQHGPRQCHLGTRLPQHTSQGERGIKSGLCCVRTCPHCNRQALLWR